LAQGSEVVPELVIDGVRYDSVRWGPVNKGRVVILHARGSAVVDLEKVPEPYRSRLTTKQAVVRGDSAAAREVQKPVEKPQAEEKKQKQEQESERARWALLNGVWVPKSELVELVGFVRSRAEAHDRGELVLRGVVVELAERRNAALEIPAHLALRPGLWKPTGERVFLKDYRHRGEMGELVRVWGRPLPETVAEMRAFEVAREPTAAEWAER
ncbi:MAG: hypothetical protein NZ483_11230, partial [Verrucomicrobiae bacterium]|nr:hypothetical protein [Verrucomicrobiae bacterium]